MAAFMAAINVGVTKTPLGSTLVVTEMAGLQVLADDSHRRGRRLVS